MNLMSRIIVYICLWLCSNLAVSDVNRKVFDSANAVYDLKKLKGLKLCQEFKDYLERKPPYYYHTDLQLDPEFEGFKLPRLTEVDKKEWFERFKTAFWGSKKKAIKKYPELKERFERHWIESEKRYWKANFKVFTAKIDVNHDGETDSLLITKLENHKTKYSPLSTGYTFNLVNDAGEYDIKKDARSGGQFFLYEGRFYIANLSEYYTVSIYEPKKPHARENKFYWRGPSICELEIVKEK